MPAGFDVDVAADCAALLTAITRQLQVSGLGTFAPLRGSDGRPRPVNGTLTLAPPHEPDPAGPLAVRVSDGASVDRANWAVVVDAQAGRRAARLPLAEPDAGGSPPPATAATGRPGTRKGATLAWGPVAAWPALLGRAEEGFVPVLRCGRCLDRTAREDRWRGIG